MAAAKNRRENRNPQNVVEIREQARKWVALWRANRSTEEVEDAKWWKLMIRGMMGATFTSEKQKGILDAQQART